MWRVETDRLSLPDDGQALSSLRWGGGNVPGECEHVFDQTRDCIVLFVQHESWAELQCWQRLLRHDFTRYTHQPCQEDARHRAAVSLATLINTSIGWVGHHNFYLQVHVDYLVRSWDHISSEFLEERSNVYFPRSVTRPQPLSLSLDWNGEVWSVTDWRTLIRRYRIQETVLEPTLHINPVMLFLFGLHYSEGIYLWHNNHITTHSYCYIMDSWYWCAEIR